MKSFAKRLISIVIIVIMLGSMIPIESIAGFVPVQGGDLQEEKPISIAQNSGESINSQGDVEIWIPASELPDGATVLERRWDYVLTTTIESGNATEAGYTCTGSEWRQIGTGSMNWATFPEGFDQNHQIYTSFAKTRPYTNSETATTKRVTTNVQAGYVYWHWMYSSSTYSNNMQRPIYNKKGVGPKTKYNYTTMQAQLSSIDHPLASSGYVEGLTLQSYNVSSEFHSFDTIGHTPRCFRFEYYSCSYVDYQKVYHHKKVENLSSSTPVAEGNGISEVVEMVRIQLSECDENGLSPWVSIDNAPDDADIVQHRWVYKLTQTQESTASSMSGWTPIGSYWHETATGQLYYGTPDGTYQWDPNDENYSIVTNHPYTPSETESAKRTVTNEEAGYCYWKWDYFAGTSSTTWKYASWDNVSETTSNGRTYLWFASVLDTEEWSRWRASANGPYFDSDSGNTSYTYKGYPDDIYTASHANPAPSYTKPAGIGSKTDCFCFYGFKYYVSRYTDYEKIYQYRKITTEVSDTEVVPGGNISDVVEQVKYVVKTNVELNNDGYYYDSVYGLKFSINDENNTATVCGINGTKTDIRIPQVVYSFGVMCKVTSIASQAFKSKSNLTSVKLSGGLLDIGSNAFEGCTNLQTIVIPSTVTSVGQAAFKNCTSLTSAVIGDALPSVSESLFEGCSLLEKVSLGRSVTEVQSRAFANCYKLLWLYFAGLVPSISSDAFSRSTTHTGDSVISFYYNNEIAWKNTDAWGHGNWLRKELSGYDANKEWLVYSATNAIYLNENAFDFQGNRYSCSTSNNTATLVGFSSEDGVKSNGSIAIPGKVFYLNREYTVTAIGQNAFKGHENVESVTISSNVSIIQANAFSNCPQLKSITIEGNLSSIGAGAFSGSSSLEGICFLGNAPGSVGANLFSGTSNAFVVCSEAQAGAFGSSWQSLPVYQYRTTSLAETYYRDNSSIYYTVIDEVQKKAIVGKVISSDEDNPNQAATGFLGSGSISVPDFVRMENGIYMVIGLDRYAFFNSSNMTGVTLGKFIGTGETEDRPGIWDGSFRGTDKLQSVTVNANNTHYKTVGGVLFSLADIGGTAVMDRLMLYPASKTGSSYTVPAQVGTVGQYAFNGQQYLQSVNLNDVNRIGENAFEGCSLLSSVTFTRVNNIEKFAFRNCKNLTSVTLPVIQSVGDGAFEECSALGTVSMSGVASIGINAFKHCSAISSFAVSSSSNYYTDASGVLFAHKDGGDTLIQYPAASHATTYTVGSSVTEVASYSFAECGYLKELNLGANLKVIGSNAFENCSLISRLSFGPRVEDIGSEAFDGCVSLKGFSVYSSGNETNRFYFTDNLGVLYAYKWDYDVANNKTPFLDDNGNAVPGSLICYPMGLQKNSYTVCAGIEEIATKAFAGNSSIVRVILPASLTDIGDMAFKDCLKLEELFFKGLVPDINSNANLFENIPVDNLTLYYTHSNQPAWTGSIPVGLRLYSRKEYNAIEELPNAITQANVYGIRVINSRGNLLSNATVSFDGTMMTMDDAGKLFIIALNNAPEQNQGVRVVVHCDGYADYNNILYLDPDLSLSYVMLAEKAKISGVSFNGEDINTKNLQINKWQFSETAGSQYIGKNSIAFVINGTCDTGAGDIVSKYGILQNGSALAIHSATTTDGLTTEADRTFEIPATALEEDGKLQAFMEVMKEDGSTESVTSDLNVTVFYKAIPLYTQKVEDETQDPSTYSPSTTGTTTKDFINPNKYISQLFSQPITIMPRLNNPLFDSIKYTFKINDPACPISVGYKVEKEKITISLSTNEPESRKDALGFDLKVEGSIELALTAKGFKMKKSTVKASLEKELKVADFEFPLGPVELQVEVKISLAGAIGLAFNVNPETGKLSSVKALLELSGKLSAKAGVGKRIGFKLFGVDISLASIFAGLKGTLGTTIEAYINPLELHNWKIKGGISAYVEASFLWMEEEWEWEFADLKFEKDIYKNGQWFPTNANSDVLSIAQLYETQLVKALDASQYAINATANVSTIKYNPTLVQLGNNQLLLLYLEDARNSAIVKNSTYDACNRHKLVYEVGTKNGNAWTWSNPAILDDNGYEDAEYQVFVDSGIPYVAYSQIEHSITASEPTQNVASHAEIKAAKWSNGRFISLGNGLTSDEYYDSAPHIAIVNGAPVVTWQKNKDNNVFGLSNHNYYDSEMNKNYVFETYANEIWSSTYDSSSGEWTSTCVADGLPYVNTFALDGTGKVLLTVDPDSNLFTKVNGENVNDNVTYELIVGTVNHYNNMTPKAGDAVLNMIQFENDVYYRAGSQLINASNGDILVDVGNEGAEMFKIVGDGNGDIAAVLFVAPALGEQDASGDILYGVFRNNGSFGEPVALTAASEDVYYQFYDAAVLNGQLVSIIKTKGVNDFEESNSIYLYKDISKADLYLSKAFVNGIAHVGENIGINAILENHGAVDVQSVNVVVRKNSANGTVVSTAYNYVLPSAIKSGASAQYLIEVPGVAAIDASDYVVSITASNETDTADNITELNLPAVDLVAVARQLNIDGETRMVVKVENQGNIDANNVVLYAIKDMPDSLDEIVDAGSELYSFNCGTVAAGKYRYYEIRLDEEFFEGNETEVVTAYVKSTFEEEDYSNNAQQLWITSNESGNVELDISLKPYLLTDSVQYEIVGGTDNVVVQFVADEYGYTLESVGEGGNISSSDYSISGNTLTITSNYVKSLGEGDHTIELVFRKGSESFARKLYLLNFKGYYTVTWKVRGTTTVESYPAGTSPEFSGSTEWPSSGEDVFTLMGWDLNSDGVMDVPAGESLPLIYEDVTYTAIYTADQKEYEITFTVDGRSTVKNYNYGDTPVYYGSLDKDATNECTYVFAGWDADNDGEPDYQNGSLPLVRENAHYVAVYNQVYNDYVVQFLDWNNAVISSQSYHYGDTVTAPANPTRPSDNIYQYTFSNWDKPVTTVTESVTYKAVYTQTYIDYTVSFVNYNGTPISSATYHYGDVVQIPENPVRTSDSQYRYEFAGWSPAVSTVSGNATYTATFTPVEHTYAAPTYVWTQTDQGYSATATAVCEDESEFTVTETVDAVYQVVTPPSCDTNGTGRYTATFVNALFTTQTKDVSIPASGHTYGTPVYTWAQDNLHVTATAICTTDSNHVLTETVSTVCEILEAATCEESGSARYTATFVNNVFSAQTKTVAVSPTGHHYNAPVFSWAKNNSTVTAIAICSYDPSHMLMETVSTAYEVTTPATCEADGVGTYTATFEESLFPVQTKTVAIPATGHDYSNPTWSWKVRAGQTIAVATYTCHCGEVLTEIINPTYSDSRGVRTYLADDGHGNTATTTKVLTYTVTYNGVEQDSVYNWGDVCVLSAETTKAWYVNSISDSNKVADGISSYAFAVTDDTVIVTDDTAFTEQQAAIMATATSTVSGKLAFNAKWSLPERATVQSVCIYRGYSRTDKVVSAEALIANGTLFNVDLLALNGDYTLHMSGLTPTYYQHVVAVVTYVMNDTTYTLISAVQKKLPNGADS